MAQRTSIANKTGQKPSIITKAAATPPNNAAGATKPAASTKPQPSAAPSAAAPTTAAAALAAAAPTAGPSNPAQPKTPVKHAGPPKQQDHLQRILMTAAAKALSAPQVTGIPAPAPAPKTRRASSAISSGPAYSDDAGSSDLASSIGR